MKNHDILINSCPLCGSGDIEYRFVAFGRVISVCSDCGHLFANPQDPQTVEIKPMYTENALHDFIQKYSNYPTEKPVVYSADTAPEEIPDKEIRTILLDHLDAAKDPAMVLKQMHQILSREGQLFLYVSTLDSINAKRLKQQWEPFEQKRLHFFSSKTIQNLLCKCGFEDITLRQANNNGIFICCKRKELREKRILSVIIPIYNEKNTVRKLLDTVYNKDLSQMGIDKEIIVIESNSTDGTREVVQEFAKEHSDVKLILEDKPRGKGHAVRNGFDAATGDFILIQDGDLEYDVNDYDKLLLPLVRYQEAFVLGSRHTGDWQMRKFGKDGRHLLANYMNVGHILLNWLMNFGCKTKLKDPFTMYKVFRRECLYGLTFEGNRFEIDWEIVIKLVRKGFIPIELPINYCSRGFKEGKKIRVIQDPITWVICFIKYRYLYKM